MESDFPVAWGPGLAFTGLAVTVFFRLEFCCLGARIYVAYRAKPEWHLVAYLLSPCQCILSLLSFHGSVRVRQACMCCVT